MEIHLNHPIKSRIAPTPSGFLHIGNGLSFLYTWLLTRKLGGSLQLRIDDIDGSRTKKKYLQDIFDTLHWLQIDWDNGPKGVADFQQNYSQQLRLPFYGKYLAKLQSGNHLFACTCSRSQIQKRSAKGLYSGTCRDLGLAFDAQQTAWRCPVPTPISVEDALVGKQELDLANEMGDFVVRKKDKKPAYQLVSLVEDLQYQTNLIVRGSDLLSSTVAQIHISRLLGELSFEQSIFIHHPLLMDKEGQKLSKSEGAPALRSIREREGKPTGVYQQCADWLEMSVQAESLGQLLEAFSPNQHFPR